MSCSFLVQGTQTPPAPGARPRRRRTTRTEWSSCKITWRPCTCPYGAHAASLLRRLLSLAFLRFFFFPLMKTVLQERVERAGILRVVVPGRVRVPLRLPAALRPVRRRHGRCGEDEVPEELRPLVLRLPRRRRAPAGCSAPEVLRPMRKQETLTCVSPVSTCLFSSSCSARRKYLYRVPVQRYKENKNTFCSLVEKLL